MELKKEDLEPTLMECRRALFMSLSIQEMETALWWLARDMSWDVKEEDPDALGGIQSLYKAVFKGVNEDKSLILLERMEQAGFDFWRASTSEQGGSLKVSRDLGGSLLGDVRARGGLDNPFSCSASDFILSPRRLRFPVALAAAQLRAIQRAGLSLEQTQTWQAQTKNTIISTNIESVAVYLRAVDAGIERWAIHPNQEAAPGLVAPLCETVQEVKEKDKKEKGREPGRSKTTTRRI